MVQAIRSSAIVVAAIWVGVLFCLGFIVAPYLFTLAARGNSVVPNTGAAADLIGPLLYGADVLGLAAGTALLLALLFLRRRRELPLGGRWYLCELGLGAAILCAAVNYWLLAPQAKVVKNQLAERYGAFLHADRADDLFRQSSTLHQASTVVFVIGFMAVLVSLVCMTRFRSTMAKT